MILVPVGETVVLQVHLDLVVHPVVDILAACASNQANNTERHTDHRHNEDGSAVSRVQRCTSRRDDGWRVRGCQRR